MLGNEIEEKTLGLYGLGNSYRDIAGHLKELYGIEVATGAISAITDKIIPLVKEWQQRPLDSGYPFVWLSTIRYGKVGAKQRSKSDYEKFLWLSLLPRAEIALYHALGNLPTPPMTHSFC